MIIEKNGKAYKITECCNKWIVTVERGTLSVTYDVPKDICRSEDDLRKYVVNNDLF